MDDKPFFCPRGVQTPEAHLQQFLTHRWVPGQGLVCMDVGVARQYDEAHPRPDMRRPPRTPMPVASWNEGNTVSLIGSFRYDIEKGELREETNGIVTEVVKVREELREKIFRQAVILELEKLGYTVISPESGA